VATSTPLSRVTTAVTLAVTPGAAATTPNTNVADDAGAALTTGGATSIVKVGGRLQCSGVQTVQWTATLCQERGKGCVLLAHCTWDILQDGNVHDNSPWDGDRCLVGAKRSVPVCRGQ
jgi:hypothetical protein